MRVFNKNNINSAAVKALLCRKVTQVESPFYYPSKNIKNTTTLEKPLTRRARGFQAIKPALTKTFKGIEMKTEKEMLLFFFFINLLSSWAALSEARMPQTL